MKVQQEWLWSPRWQTKRSFPDLPCQVATNHQFKWGTETSPQPVQVLVFILHFWRAAVVHFKNCSSCTIPLWARNHSSVLIFLEFSPTGNWEPTLGHLQIKQALIVLCSVLDIVPNLILHHLKVFCGIWILSSTSCSGTPSVASDGTDVNLHLQSLP